MPFMLGKSRRVARSIPKKLHPGPWTITVVAPVFELHQLLCVRIFRRLQLLFEKFLGNLRRPRGGRAEGDRDGTEQQTARESGESGHRKSFETGRVGVIDVFSRAGWSYAIALAVPHPRYY
jgi:hypothetical protein